MSSPQRQPVLETGADAQDAIGFVLRLGRALHTYGFPANQLEETMGKAAATLGLEGQFFSTPTSIFASFGPQDDQRTFLIRVKPGEVNLGKLTALDVIVTRVLRGQVTPAEGSAKVEWTLGAPPTYGRAITTLAFGMASAGASRFLGGGLKEIALSGVIGLVIGLLLIGAERNGAIARVFEPLAAFTASALAVAFSFAFGAYSVSNATLAGLIVLIPGLTLTVAMIELSTQHLSSGTARHPVARAGQHRISRPGRVARQASPFRRGHHLQNDHYSRGAGRRDTNRKYYRAIAARYLISRKRS